MMNQPEQRSRRERRHRIRPFSIPGLRGRRRRLRRADDSAGEEGRLDLYPPALLVITVAILLLCALDAHNTLLILQLGGREINPLMDYLIQTDHHLFVAGKFFLTGSGLLLFVGYHHVALWRHLKVRYILYGLLVLYLFLIAYQWVLLAR